MAKRILLAGGSGAVGSRLLQKLIAHNEVGEIHLLNRRPQEIVHPKVIQHHIEFDHMDALDLELNFDQAYCCLGTTIKQAGSKGAFEKIDLHYVQCFALMAKRHQCTNFAAISSIGAKTKTNNFYLHTKGRMEETLTSMGWKSLWIFRPSLLVGHREEFRLAEHFGGFLIKLISPFMLGPAKKYRPIHMDTVANTMANIMSAQSNGVNVVESGEIALLSTK